MVLPYWRLIATPLFPLIMLSAPVEAWACAVPDRYRMEHYRAPTPHCVPGARTVYAEEAHALAAAGAVMIDVAPALRGTLTDFDGTWLVGEPRRHIAGSVWLPNVGRGTLDATMHDYFRRHLTQLSGGDPATPLLFYCYADCWMSWNAAKRAREYGYSEVIWYPLGTDGWRERGWPLVPAEPVPLL